MIGGFIEMTLADGRKTYLDAHSVFAITKDTASRGSVVSYSSAMVVDSMRVKDSPGRVLKKMAYAKAGRYAIARSDNGDTTIIDKAKNIMDLAKVRTEQW